MPSRLISRYANLNQNYYQTTIQSHFEQPPYRTEDINESETGRRKGSLAEDRDHSHSSFDNCQLYAVS